MFNLHGPANKERIIRELAALIDFDSPPGLAANELARAAVSLVVDRESPQALLLADEINALHRRFPREQGD
jgi:hypothetical protein